MSEFKFVQNILDHHVETGLPPAQLSEFAKADEGRAVKAVFDIVVRNDALPDQSNNPEAVFGAIR
ncbi:hypothetical protein [Mesorhizobium sp. P5_C1]